MIKNIFFDFDGVLAESVDVKTQAFYNLYLPYGKEIAEKVKQHHLENGGVSRFEKIKLYHQTFLGQKIDNDIVHKFANKFSHLVKKAVISAPEVKGANAFLERYKNRYKYWVITGTPTDEMGEIIEQRDMPNCFVEICGSPEKKKYWTEYLIDKYKLKRKETIFVGDAVTDFEASLYSKLTFYLRRTPYNVELFKDYSGFSFTDFNKFEKILLK